MDQRQYHVIRPTHQVLAEYGYDSNKTNYACKTIDCRCMPGEMLCGKDGSIDLTDLLKDEIKGPASFKCENGDCAFSGRLTINTHSIILSLS
jgi:hypothetical protein